MTEAGSEIRDFERRMEDIWHVLKNTPTEAYIVAACKFSPRYLRIEGDPSRRPYEYEHYHLEVMKIFKLAGEHGARLSMECRSEILFLIWDFTLSIHVFRNEGRFRYSYNYTFPEVAVLLPLAETIQKSGPLSAEATHRHEERVKNIKSM